MRRGQGGLGTSLVILLDQLDESSDPPEEPLISAVTLAQLSFGPLVADEEGERAVLRHTPELGEYRLSFQGRGVLAGTGGPVSWVILVGMTSRVGPKGQVEMCIRDSF